MNVTQSLVTFKISNILVVRHSYSFNWVKITTIKSHLNLLVLTKWFRQQNYWLSRLRGGREFVMSTSINNLRRVCFPYTRVDPEQGLLIRRRRRTTSHLVCSYSMSFIECRKLYGPCQINVRYDYVDVSPKPLYDDYCMTVNMVVTSTTNLVEVKTYINDFLLMSSTFVDL